MKKKEYMVRGTLIEASDSAKLASSIDGRARKPHQLVSILLDGVSKTEFMHLALSKRVVIIVEA